MPSVVFQFHRVQSMNDSFNLNETRQSSEITYPINIIAAVFETEISILESLEDMLLEHLLYCTNNYHLSEF